MLIFIRFDNLFFNIYIYICTDHFILIQHYDIIYSVIYKHVCMLGYIPHVFILKYVK